MPQEVPTNEEGVDLSNYYSQPQNQIHTTQTPTNKPVGNFITRTKRIWIFILILIILAGIQVFIIVRNPKATQSIPAGYKIVKPTNGPPRVEKIK